MMRALALASAALVSALVATHAAAEPEISGFFGALRSRDPAGRSFGLSLAYTRHFGNHVSASVAYINEGHVPSHHRDGIAPQLWLRTNAQGPGLDLALGAGPYRYFDTTIGPGGSSFTDRHGWGRVYSASATWRAARTPLLYEIRYNRILVRDDMDTSMVLAGIGYRLDRDEEAAAPGTPEPARGEATLYRGQTIVNSFESERDRAWSAEYRRRFGNLTRGSVAWLDEGSTPILRRKGIATHLWLEPTFYDNRLSIGLGVGPYLHAYDTGTRDGLRLSPIVSFTASYAFAERVVARVMWHRVSSGYDRDSDVLLAGLGVRF